MSTENNANDQRRISRRGPDPRFVWGIVILVFLCGILYAGYYQLNESSAELTKVQKNIATFEGMKKKLQEDNNTLEEQNKELQKLKAEITILESHPGARRIVKGINDIEFAFRWCPAGTFMMGSPGTEEGRDKDETLHEVTLSKGFWMLETEVTVGMFKAFVSSAKYEPKGEPPHIYNGSKDELNPNCSWSNPGFEQNDNHPVTCVSWDDAVEFCKWLSKKTGHNIQLPTETQWEYACRAGTEGQFAGDLDQMTWYRENSNKKSHPVQEKKCNPWGLYDMHGNVREWCQDKYIEEYSRDNVTDPIGSVGDHGRVFRGGDWSSNSPQCRSANRGADVSGFRVNRYGFRIVLIP